MARQGVCARRLVACVAVVFGVQLLLVALFDPQATGGVPGLAWLDHRDEMAWAIPVGGRSLGTRRASIARLLDALLAQGVHSPSIYLFVDDGSLEGRPLPRWLHQLAVEKRVNMRKSGVVRTGVEPPDLFGLYLARHYHYMLDTLLHNAPPAVLYEFVVVLEDDLVLATDAVAYFRAMATVMRADTTLFCASAHTDNAFFAHTPPANVYDPTGATPFPFRRARHFMAPGWMTSRSVYERLRPLWFDATGARLARRAELRMPNGNWDAFFDATAGEYECLFAEVPRIAHRGAAGYTVSSAAQRELFDNLRLSALPAAVDYGDLSWLEADAYDERVRGFVKHSKRLSSLAQVREGTGQRLVLALPTRSDADPLWNAAMDALGGLVGIGGHANHGKVRGTHKGAVFARAYGNVILLVGYYSPFLADVGTQDDEEEEETAPPPLPVSKCLTDARDKRALPVLVGGLHAPPAFPLTVTRCVRACEWLGHPLAGVENGNECWCGDARGVATGGHVQAPVDECRGGMGEPFRLTVYATAISQQQQKQEGEGEGGDGVTVVRADPGVSCTVACSDRKLRCDDERLAVIGTACAALKATLDCRECATSDIMVNGFAAPGKMSWESATCLVAKSRYLRCDAETPTPVFVRACACVPAA